MKKIFLLLLWSVGAYGAAAQQQTDDEIIEQYLTRDPRTGRRPIDDVNEVGFGGKTLLGQSICSGSSPSVIVFLLRHGADVNAGKGSVLYHAFRNYPRGDDSVRSRINEIVDLLLQEGVDTTRDYNRMTPFLIACYMQSIPGIEFLREKKLLCDDINVEYLELKEGPDVYKGDVSFSRIGDKTVHGQKLLTYFPAGFSIAENFFNENYRFESRCVIPKTAEEKAARKQWADARR